ncbi:MAG: S8 family serine peptidase [Bacteroidota bacterium]|nr:S8 family serine peptidase [Bacteroidota bacterium]
MNRIYPGFLLALFSSVSLCISAQRPMQFPVFKNGSFSSGSGILHHKLNHPGWQSVRFGKRYFLLVHFDHIPNASERSDLASRGFQLDQYVSNNNWLALWNDGNTKKNLERSAISEIYAIPPELKISQKLKTNSPQLQTPEDLIAVSCFGGIDATTIKQELQNAGAEIINTKIKPAHIIFIKAGMSVLEKIAQLPFIASIDPQRIKDVPLNYNNRATHGVQALAATLGRNLMGKGVTVGIGDDGEPSSHIDFSGRLIMRTDEPSWDVHGVHTSGTLAGGGILNPMYAGMAPRARLVTNDFTNILINAPVYTADYNMILTNNSYFSGLADCPGEGDYDALSNFVDSQLIAFPKLLHVFAAGNDGPLTCSPYPLAFATIKSGFQTAKDVITVGNLDASAYTIFYGSSRGPVNDGRIKPELVAGGTNIVSTFPNNAYSSASGTSMASPTVTGILALVYQRYRQLHGGADPDAALIKALVCNSADDLGNPGPDFTYGFGMINARTTVEALEQNHYFGGSISQGNNASFTIPSLPSGAHQLKLMLYWPDPAALPFAATTLVNDLDLTVTDPSGTTHLPLILDPSAANVSNNAAEGADHTNNIEQVVINNPPAGTYTIAVKGTSIPRGPQPFYISYEILQPSVTVEYPFGTETWVPGASENIRWSAYGGEPNSFTLEFSSDGGSTWTLISNSIPSTARSFSWIVPNLVTRNALIRVTRNSAGYSDTSDYPFTILGQPLLAVSNPCPGYAHLLWNIVPGATGYDIMKLSADTMQVIGSTTDTTYLITPLNKDSSYWFSVRATVAGTAGRRAVAGNVVPNGGPCALTGLDNDLVLDALQTPVTGRMFSSTQLGITRIKVAVRNAGSVPATSMTFSYQVNGGPVVSELFAGSVPGHTTVSYIFSAAGSYDFSAPGTYNIKTWVSYAADPTRNNDTLCTIVRQLKNDPLDLSPSFTEGFESAPVQSWTMMKTGLDSLDRADFNNSNSHGRMNSFFNSGFARTGNRSITLDVINSASVAADSLITTFNLSNYTATDQIWLDLYFKKQSVMPGYPGNKIWIRGNDQATWIPVRDLTDPSDLPGAYIHLNVDVSGVLAKASPAQTVSSSFQVRCGAEGSTPAASPVAGGLPGGGISFDDFMISKSTNDAGMVALVQPALKNICALSDAEKVSVIVKNYGTDSLLLVPVSFSVNADTVTENIPFIAPKDSVLYTFSKTVDMSAFQAYHLKTWVSYPPDNYHYNDSSADYLVQTTPLINEYPYLEGFENNNGYWYTQGLNDNWQWGKPQKTIIHKAANGSKAWVTNLTGNYNDNEYAYLYSPCFDLSSLTQPVLSFSHIFKTEDDCDCDFHWVEYSVDDSVWNILGNTAAGVNWYDKTVPLAWQKSDPKWHVSSFDIPVKATKVRFRIAMYSDPGTNDEGVGIDDVHIFDKAPVFSDSLSVSLSQPVSGTGWTDFERNGKKILSINPNGQDLGNVALTLFIDSGAIRDTAGQYYAGRNWVVRPETQPNANVSVRYYFTDSEMNQLIADTSCAVCTNQEDAYESGITQYSSSMISEEDSTLHNNLTGNYIFHKPQQEVQVIPYDNGYYAETQVSGFSEFWINGGGLKQDHPLAAWLANFAATRKNSTGLLSWTTWQENGTSRFVIEKSGDSIAFAAIGSVSAHPHPDSTADYTFTDPQLYGGHNYYRLKLIFQNGDSLYSPVRQIFYDPGQAEIQVFPNPTTGQVTINTSSECRDIQIFDASGRQVYRKTTNGFQQTISLITLSRGIYLMQLTTDKGRKVLKIEKR